jgi:hypothetical protein
LIFFIIQAQILVETATFGHEFVILLLIEYGPLTGMDNDDVARYLGTRLLLMMG